MGRLQLGSSEILGQREASLLRKSEVCRCSPPKPQLSTRLFLQDMFLHSLKHDAAAVPLNTHQIRCADSWETTQLESLVCVQRDYSCSPLEVCLPQAIKDTQSKQ